MVGPQILALSVEIRILPGQQGEKIDQRWLSFTYPLVIILIFQHEVQVLNSLHRGVAQLIERSVWDREAGGLSPLTPTKFNGSVDLSRRLSW